MKYNLDMARVLLMYMPYRIGNLFSSQEIQKDLRQTAKRQTTVSTTPTMGHAGGCQG